MCILASAHTLQYVGICFEVCVCFCEFVSVLYCICMSMDQSHLANISRRLERIIMRRWGSYSFAVRVSVRFSHTVRSIFGQILCYPGPKNSSDNSRLMPHVLYQKLYWNTPQRLSGNSQLTPDMHIFSTMLGIQIKNRPSKKVATWTATFPLLCFALVLSAHCLLFVQVKK